MRKPIRSLKFLSAMKVTTLIIILLSLFVVGAYLGHLTTPKDAHTSYYVLLETETQENYTVYLPLPDLSSKETEDLINNFQPRSEFEFDAFSPFLDIGYNKSEISLTRTEYGEMLKISAEGSIFLYSNINTRYEASTVFLSGNTSHIFFEGTNSYSNVTIKFFVFKETSKNGFFDFNYLDTEFCSTSRLHPDDTERFTYISELNFMHDSDAISLKQGWNEYPMYSGRFDVCID